MSGPRRHGSRFIAAACSFALLTLSILLLRDGVASAHATVANQHHGSNSASAATGLLGGLGDGLGGLGKVVTKVGHTVDKVLTGVGTVLGNHPRVTPTSPAPPRSSTPISPSTPPPHTRSNTPAPHSTDSGRAPASNPAGAATHPSGQVGASRPSAHVTLGRASPVTASVTPHRTPTVATASHVANALNTQSTSQIPGLDITAALAAMMIAMVLGVGLIVYRAGYRGERTH